MKKLAFLAFVILGISQTAIAGEKEAAEALYRDATPIWKLGTIIDSNGCLWGITEDQGVVKPIRIVLTASDGTKKPYCPKKK